MSAEQFQLDGMILQGLSARHDPREVVADPSARYYDAISGERTLVPGADVRLATTRLADWLHQPATAR